MALPIEDYAVIGDTQTAALVGRDGSIDWLCLPRFDSGASFAALLGTTRHGRWLLAPTADVRRTSRAYRGNTLVLESEFDTEDGSVRVIDFMPPRQRAPDLVRIVEGVSGRVPMRMEFAPRFDYGAVSPWVTTTEDGRTLAVAGPDALTLDSPIPIELGDGDLSATFAVDEGDTVAFVAVWYPSYETPAPSPDAARALEETVAWWEGWAAECTYEGGHRELVTRSLLTLKALTYAPSGGIVAAPTTSLPEHIGGVRNWDYRYCWVRDATFTLDALLLAGYEREASEWRDWLVRAVAGRPDQLNLMYGPTGERRLPELELPWLPGYEGSVPVRTGNAACAQFQLDVYGEVMDVMYQARRAGVPHSEEGWDLQVALMDTLEGRWRDPDEGIWEVRSTPRHFTHSKVMAWVAADRAVKSVEREGCDGPVDRWRRLAAEIHDDVCDRGFDPDRNTFVQSYDDDRLDGSLLMIPLVGFLPAHDARVAGTVDAVQRELCEDGFVLRYRTDDDGEVDGLPGGEGAFLPCTFWLADNLALLGRTDEARALFARLRDLCNDVGLLSEEYDPGSGRLLGNFPQAFSHESLVNTAQLISNGGPLLRRPED